MPRWQRADGGSAVMSVPRHRTWPASGRTSPVIRLNRVDLPAPFGPSTPRASPGAREKLRLSVTVSEP